MRYWVFVIVWGCGAAAPLPTASPEQSTSEIPQSEARRQLLAMPDPFPDGGLDVWWSYAELALEAYAEPCPSSEHRDAINRARVAARDAQRNYETQLQQEGELDDPDDDASLDGIEDERQTLRDDLSDAEEERELHMSTLEVAWGEWSYSCVQTITDDFSGNDADMNALALLEEGLARLAR